MDKRKKGRISILCQKTNLLLLSNIVVPRKLRARRELNSHGFSVQSIFENLLVNYSLESKFGIGSKFISFEKMFK